MSVKSKTGSCDSGVYDSDDLQFVFVSDADYAANNNTAKCWITLKSDGSIAGNLSGTANIAKNIPTSDVGGNIWIS